MENLKNNIIETDLRNESFGYGTKDYFTYAIKCNWRIPEICGDCEKAYEDFFLNSHCKRKEVLEMEEKCPNCHKGYLYPHPSRELICDKCHIHSL